MGKPLTKKMAASGRQDSFHVTEDCDPLTLQCKRLWQCVLLQAFTDSLTESQKPENITVKREAIAWLRGNAPNFDEVCGYAGYPPEMVKQRAKEVLYGNGDGY